MRRLLVVPFISAAVVAGTVASGVVGAGQAPGPAGNVAKTTIGMTPTAPAPTGPPQTAPVPTAPVPTVAPPSTVPPLTAATVTDAAATVPPPTAGAPTTEASGLSPESIAAALPAFGLDATRLQCLATALPQFGADDNTALAALQGCGVALMPLLRGIVDMTQRSNSFLDPSATTVPLPTVPGAAPLPPEDAFFIGFMLLILPEEAQCLATGVAAAPSQDDAAALGIMQGCAVPVGRTLEMLLFALESDGTSIPVATTLPTITAPISTVVGVPTVPGPPTTFGSVSPDSPLVDEFQEMLLEEEGITLDDAQAACLLSQIEAGTIEPADTDDVGAMIELLEACGITLTDLVPSDLATIESLV